MKLNEISIKLMNGYNNSKIWRQIGSKLKHRLNDLPAIEYLSGSKEWFINGLRHRDGDKPAIEWCDGTKEWWKDGKRHRDGGKPAYTGYEKYKAWWINGKFIKSEKASK